ncbi:MAG: histidinol-phosphate transaminase [Candidatus Aminicenantes bacterium]|nr:histidinol-phosphate transaminase [Candidatus Aminicenantes bacterium]MBL7082072.1 histidinol-phosphate transaminase [Candidatus Aminicenantes bacterium]
MKKLIRDNVLRIEQYEPGMPVEVLKRELAIEGEFSNLASNENPLGPSPLAINAIKKSLENGNLYPDNRCYYLKEKIAEHLGVPSKNLGVGNGTTELIYLIGVAFLNPGETFIMSESSFIMAKIIAQIMDNKLIEVPLKEYRHDLNNILRKITSDTKIVYFDNPMNPIGTVVAQQEFSMFMEKIPEDIIVVFDEAYYEYVNSKNFPNTLRFIEEGRNVIVLRTFSKMYGLAGFRVGYCAAKEEFIDAINRVSPPFSVNRFAQIGAVAALKDKTFIERTKEMNESGKKYLYENFEKMSVFYIPSETNFVTIDVKKGTKRIFEELQRKSVIVRPLTMYGKPTFLRVTVGTPEQNRRFIEAFKQVYKD